MKIESSNSNILPYTLIGKFLNPMVTKDCLRFHMIYFRYNLLLIIYDKHFFPISIIAAWYTLLFHFSSCLCAGRMFYTTTTSHLHYPVYNPNCAHSDQCLPSIVIPQSCHWQCQCKNQTNFVYCTQQFKMADPLLHS